ncbi:acyl-CoA dehydrogenase [Betaproteobacteria bacterium]|nr:acyl-CoA dehydrogenase [Betaproteobacteria bacterium]GHT98446.1 acyl-CoA dehydrogenase [Betaproteobacteria bacterium]GHU06999.1 acyl-CoA dehydrogenase [Betaproteobacteria bacterium]GHU16817.1 acyl-CoA dehydrogenase [Betaproteobacteria bacterium]
MSTYNAPLADMRFLLNEIAGLKDILNLPAFAELDADTVDDILKEAAKFATEVVDPVNIVGDRQTPPVWKDGVVTISKEYKDAYKLFCETGWHAMPGNPEFGGQGLPNLVNFAVNEMWRSASIAFALCPMLTMGAAHAIENHASDEIKQKYLPKMIDGTWGGTMNLTEPQAGSDLTAIRTKAKPNPNGDGTYLISGTKIFITWGEHDMAENIIHLVLARLPNSDPGLKGISLFVVPKYFVNDDGSLGARNDLICSALEHKLGIKGSATAVMSYGDHEGAVGWLVGKEGNGIAYMFTMMNHARIHVGLEGIGVAERAYQHALSYARERIQGAIIGDAESKTKPKPILFHPDVRRLLLDMKSRTEALRAIGYFTAGQLDFANFSTDPAAKKKALAYVELLTPIVKGWSTESSIDITSEGIQVHGGTGFIEETGAAQYLRDSRITAIYEGTTAIQANDYIGRKTAREVNKETGEVGFTARALYKEVAAFADDLAKDAKLGDIGKNLQEAIKALIDATEWAITNYGPQPQVTSAGSVPYLKLGGIVLGGWLLAKSALLAQNKIAAGETSDYYQGKIATTRYYAKHWLVQASAIAREIIEGGESVLGLDEPLF